MASIPPGITAFLFDMDGVLTDTARVHSAAWKQMFDEELRRVSDETGTPFQPFDVAADYHAFVDGKPRYDGVRAFLASRGIERPDDGDEHSVTALGDRKNALVQERIREGGVDVYPDALTFLHAVRERGHGTALVSSSANARAIVAAAGLDGLFDSVVDGTSLAPRGLRGKPAPDSFVAAAEDLGATVAQAAVVEDAIAGVVAGRDGGFGLVVGVDRHGDPQPLLDGGADVVVPALTDLTFTPTGDPV
jgi:beta-phosphoglucomutase family hydrolase